MIGHEIPKNILQQKTPKKTIGHTTAIHVDINFMAWTAEPADC